MPDTAEVWRIFTLPDGKSSMEKLEVQLPNGRSAMFGAKGVQIATMTPSTGPNWHTGPRRQMLATISGQGEIETGDGQKLTVKPGVITLIEDLTGDGHITRTSPEGRVALVFPLEDGVRIE